MLCFSDDFVVRPLVRDDKLPPKRDWEHNVSSPLLNRRVGDDKLPPKCNTKTLFIRKIGDEKSLPKDATIGDDREKTQIAKVSPKHVCKYWMNGDCVRVRLFKSHDGVIFAWRGSSKSNSPFELVASLRGHTKSVVCLAVGCNKMLYSGSKDQSIKVWDLHKFECKMTLNAHTGEVTSLICWDKFLLSGSSNCTIKVWYKTAEDPLEVAYSHNVENIF
ncbi:zinc finger CCCH domain-containing protein 48-like [Vicia villosa]|uniref:zinc finger CCCH domain-containing protein 48-like n=1 Tax=Vicia villosa TaxID=3911 RepID=UPI00273CDBB6|nr:zinc finger CCCH domain-containing protein 48-like [Vicia villosa]